MRIAVPWVLCALVAGAWIGSAVLVEDTVSTPAVAPALGMGAAAGEAEVTELRAAVDALRAEVRALQAERASPGPVLHASGSAPTPASRPQVVPRSEAFRAREDAARTLEAAQAQRKTWYDAVRSLKDGSAREAALTEMRAAFGGKDEARRLAALQLARWLGDTEYDRADWRKGILPHVKSEDAATRQAALIALAWVQPEASDLAWWADAAKGADRNNAEELARAIVKTADGVLRGAAADAVLELLRDGTDIKKAFVIRGLQGVKEWDPAAETRLIEIVRAAPAHDYDSAYYFHFITSRLDPKSDAVVDLMLEKIEEGKGEIETIVRGFRVGLDERQRDRVADALLGYAENAANASMVRNLAQGLAHVATARHVGRMQALIAGEGVDRHVIQAVERALEAARTRR